MLLKPAGSFGSVRVRIPPRARLCSAHGAGTYSRVFIGRTAGVALDPMDEVTAETVGARLDDIRDASRFTTPADVMEVLSDVFAQRFEYGDAQ